MVKELNDQTVSEIVFFALCEHEINYDIIVNELDKQGHFNEDNQSLYKTFNIEPKLQELDEFSFTEI